MRRIGTTRTSEDVHDSNVEYVHKHNHHQRVSYGKNAEQEGERGGVCRSDGVPTTDLLSLNPLQDAMHVEYM